MKHNEVILHGEAMIFPANIPTDAVEIKPTNEQYHIIADSETTGNHHVIDLSPAKRNAVKIFKNSAGTMFMENKTETSVSCVLANRHSPIAIPPGTYEFGIAQEYDHFAQNLRNVRD